MTEQVHVLTAGFTSPNGAGFLMPLVLHRDALQEAGFAVRLFRSASARMLDCDALLLDSRMFASRWNQKSDAALEEISDYRRLVGNLIYVDLFDSAAWPHARAMPYVTLYCKSQVLKDRSAYLRPLYGGRCFTDYYHRKMGVNDDSPIHSEPVPNPEQLDKLTVSWNSGLSDYSWLGRYRIQAYPYVGLSSLLQFPGGFAAPSTRRDKDVSCRIGTQYARESVAYQRKRLAGLLRERIDTIKLSRRHYLQELRRCKVVVSPFGFGEICYRDFETFMAGALLFKPDMSTIETWPDLYRDGETIVAHRWDLSDVLDRLETIVSDYSSYVGIAVEGQTRYRRYLTGPDAGRLFAERFAAIIAKGRRLAA